MLRLRISLNSALQKVANVVINEVTWAILALDGRDFLARIDEAFLGALRHDNQAATLALNALYDLVV